MSIPNSFQELRVNVEKGEKIGNKTGIPFTPSGDNNANQITSITHQGGRVFVEDTSYNTSSIPPLVRQRESPDKLVIWGSEQQCIQPGLRECDLLESQELHAFLRNRDEEEEDDGGSFRDGKDEGAMSISSSSTASSASTGVRRNDNDSNKMESRVERGKERRVACHSSEDLDTCVSAFVGKRDNRSGRDRQKGGLKESKSETNVFVSSLSTVSLSGSLSSALDSSGEASFISLTSSMNHPYANVNNTTSVQYGRRTAPVHARQNFLPMNQQVRHDCPQYFNQDPRLEKSQHRNGLSSDGILGQRRKAGFEERVMPPRRQQLVRPLCQTEMGKERRLIESKAKQTEMVLPTSPNLSPQSHDNGSNRKFIKSSLREPSDFSHLYNTSGVCQVRQINQTSQREAPQMEKQSAVPAQQRSSPPNNPTLEKRPQTQLTYRRNCSSPNRTGIESRSSTPPNSPLRTPQGSPRRQPSMYFVSRNVSGVTRHIPSGCNPAVPTSTQGYGNSCLRAPVKTNVSTSGVSKAPLHNQHSYPNLYPRESSPSPKLKPKGVRPKIITSVRKNPQFKPQVADGPYQVSSLPSRLSTCTHSQTPPPCKDRAKDSSNPDTLIRGAPVLSASNLLYDKYRQEMQGNNFSSGIQSRGIRAPGNTNTVPPAHAHSHTAPPKLGSKVDDFYGAPPEVGRSISLKGSCAEDALQSRTAAQAGGSGSLLHSGRGLRLGLGAVTRTTTASAKGKAPSQGPRSALIFSQPVNPVSPATSHRGQDTTDGQNLSHQAPAPPASAASSQSGASRSLLPKASQSGLRPPGFSSSRLPASRLAAFGFVRSSSISSVSSSHSAESTQSDPCRTAHCVAGNEEPPFHRVTSNQPAEPQRTCRSNSLQPPSTPALPRRYLPPQPRSSPGVGRKEFQRSSEVTRSLPSSPKRLAVVTPKPQTPVQPGQRPAAAVRGSAPSGSPGHVPPAKLLREQQESLQREKEEAQQKERERQAEEGERREVQRLQGHCEQQERQLRALRNQLKKMSLGVEAFIITTQHYCLKSDTAEGTQKKLSMEIQRIREELVTNLLRWEKLQKDKTALEMVFERELEELQHQQEAELAAVEENLRKCHATETEKLRAEHRSEMAEMRAQQQEQLEEITTNQQAALQELRAMHNITMATLHEEHARTMRDLRKAHEQQKTLLEDNFEKLRLSLQDEVDTLTFQNQSLKKKAKRYEEALKRNTDEKIHEALAPYKHIEQDLQSLKEVVEMKNEQIHLQEKKITDLEKVAQKNIYLEEKVQVLQQQNEDLTARIEKNLALSRKLSEDNANLQESVEKESTEKKRLSRNNEELLWRLQTSPLMSPASSPLHRSFSPSPIASTLFFSSSPIPGCDSPTHCPGCPLQGHYGSPTHRVAALHSFSAGPATPTHRAANQNCTSGSNTPIHQPSPTRCNANMCTSAFQS